MKSTLLTLNLWSIGEFHDVPEASIYIEYLTKTFPTNICVSCYLWKFYLHSFGLTDISRQCGKLIETTKVIWNEDCSRKFGMDVLVYKHVLIRHSLFLSFRISKFNIACIYVYMKIYMLSVVNMISMIFIHVYH